MLFGHIDDALINNAGVRDLINYSSYLLCVLDIPSLFQVLMRGVLLIVPPKLPGFYDKIMALELGEHNIKVNAIAPGLFRSEITEKLVQKDWLNNVAKKCSIKTFGTTDPALTSLVRYLVHDSSNYVSVYIHC
ncbi:hypothetical protein HAX54_043547 [Datura stramonium]|uniref:Uncharacterized protein n=1 Tax=Datura stramonium TaxID=4076 RepID=A0ABS8W1E9_DATST|nr:hypothetical protein [Datura stramonium]